MLRVLEEVNNDELKLDDDGEFSVSRNSRQTETEKTTQIRDKLQNSGRRENLRKSEIVCQVIMVQSTVFIWHKV